VYGGGGREAEELLFHRLIVVKELGLFLSESAIFGLQLRDSRLQLPHPRRQPQRLLLNPIPLYSLLPTRLLQRRTGPVQRADRLFEPFTLRSFLAAA
jgi:hypothetical protein